MPSRPSLNGKQIIRVLERLGFEVVRISEGSHHILRKPGRSTIVVVPVHGSRDVPKGTFQSILRQAGIRVDEFFDVF